ncbi:MAG: ester cyclase [Acidobacteria bacterium]|nr:ester cyclase [Acidobacteriota bacterium]
MTSDEIRAFLDRFVHAWERQDITALSACYADDCEIVSPIFGRLKGRAQVEKSYTDLFKAFASPTVRMDDTIACNSDPARAVIVWTVQSTHAGEVFGMPATGRRIERTMAYLFTLRDGLIIRERRVYDFTSMLMQLGVLKARPA